MSRAPGPSINVTFTFGGSEAIWVDYSLCCGFPSLALLACPIAARVTSGASGPWAIDARY